jgi:hypothetical protein
MKQFNNKPIYHVRHDLQPTLTLELLVLLWDKSPCRPELLHKVAETRGYRLAQRSLDQLLASLGNLRILERNDNNDLILTRLGKLIAHTAKNNPDLVSELIHFTYYTLYDGTNPALRFSWSYRQVCEHLWYQGTHQLDPHRLVTLIQEEAQQAFADFEEYGASFSRDSVNGIVNWLEVLEPSCVNLINTGTRIFSRRTICPSEIVLLAMEYTKSKFANSNTTQLQLTTEVRKSVAKLCLLEEEVIEEVIQDAAQAFNLLYRQTERGQWISLLGERSSFPLSVWF